MLSPPLPVPAFNTRRRLLQVKSINKGFTIKVIRIRWNLNWASLHCSRNYRLVCFSVLTLKIKTRAREGCPPQHAVATPLGSAWVPVG